MKSNAVYKIVIFINVIFFYFIFFNTPAIAQNTAGSKVSVDSLKFYPQVTLPDTEFEAGIEQGIPVGTETNVGGERMLESTLLARYIAAVFKLSVLVAITLAIVMIMVGGFLWTIAGGSQERVTNAKSYISHALTGLVIALLSYGILQGVNPQVLKLQFPPIKLVHPIQTNTLDCCMDLYTGGMISKTQYLQDSETNKALTCEEISKGKWVSCDVLVSCACWWADEPNFIERALGGSDGTCVNGEFQKECDEVGQRDDQDECVFEMESCEDRIKKGELKNFEIQPKSP